MRKIIKVVKQIIPEGLKARIVSSELYNRIAARRLASSSKRLDICSAEIAHILHEAGRLSVRDKICCEIGSGWVLSHALVLYLLGAKKVIITDVQRQAYPSVALYPAIHSSRLFLIKNILSPFEDHSQITARLDKLVSINNWSFNVLKELGIEYVAPHDWALSSLNEKVDFIYSFSVLEHVPVSDILPVLQNLATALSEEGRMIHCVHLEDHKDIPNSPFGFLTEPEEMFTRKVQTKRGNRIRASQWQEILTQVKDLKFKFIYKWIRRDKELPSIIDPSIKYLDDEDLAISNIGILGQKSKKLNP